jgi:hypothetical protein
MDLDHIPLNPMSTLLLLPTEIRIIILSKLLSRSDVISLNGIGSWKQDCHAYQYSSLRIGPEPINPLAYHDQPLFSQVLRVCHQFYCEGLPILYQSNVFRVTYAQPSAIMAALASMGSQNTAMIKKIQLLVDRTQHYNVACGKFSGMKKLEIREYLYLDNGTLPVTLKDADIETLKILIWHRSLLYHKLHSLFSTWTKELKVQLMVTFMDLRPGKDRFSMVSQQILAQGVDTDFCRRKCSMRATS